LPKTEREKEERSAPASDKKTASPAPVSHIQEAPTSQPDPASSEPKPVTNRVTPITPVPPTGQKSSYSISTHPKTTPASATPASRSTMQNANKDSKINSIFKKAGRILKKPF
jgi:hypothetical protein